MDVRDDSAVNSLMWVDLDKTYYYLDFSGPSFSPTKLEEKTKLILHEKLEVGTPLNFLPRRLPGYGKPATNGWAQLQAPENIKPEHQREWLLKTLDRHHRTFRRLGATDIVFWEVRYLGHHSQENFELFVPDIEILHRAKVPFCISVYHLNKKELRKIPARLYQNLWAAKPNP